MLSSGNYFDVLLDDYSHLLVADVEHDGNLLEGQESMLAWPVNVGAESQYLYQL